MIHFSPNCTLPLAAPAFVDSANMRGTMDIVWSSLSIILLCTWSILHLNVPPQNEPVGISQKIGKAAFELWRKIKWMIITVFSPEIILGLAAVDLYAARASHEEIAKLAEEDGVPWSLSHSYFANIGGFAIRFPDDPIESMSAEGKAWQWRMLTQQLKGAPWRWRIKSRADDSRKPVSLVVKSTETSGDGDGDAIQPGAAAGVRDAELREGATHGNSVAFDKDVEASKASDPLKQVRLASEPIGHANDFPNVLRRYAMRSYFCGDMPWAPHKSNSTLVDNILSNSPSGENITNLRNRLLPVRGNFWVLNAWGLIEARRTGIITRLPYVTESDLADRDKGDTLSKLIAVVQVTWLMGQLIERRYYGQPSSQLEIMTLAFAVEAFAIYLLLLRRPKDVSTHTYLPAARAPSS